MIRFARTASRPYIQMTEYILKQAGIKIERTSFGFAIPGMQKASALEYTCEKDMSAAAVPAVCAVIGKRTLEVRGMKHSVLQGDRVITDILEKMGGRYEETADGTVWYPSELHGTEIDLRDCPDLGPVLFAAAVRAEGKTVFRNAGRLREKESDRIECMQRELQKLGVRMTVDEEDTVTVYGEKTIHGGCEVSGHGDHRVVMALAVLGAAAEEPVTICGCEAVRKSWPDFFSELKQAGIGVTGISE
jgi:3-phosphoshikimate 1-carboxyvinyltransferase